MRSTVLAVAVAGAIHVVALGWIGGWLDGRDTWLLGSSARQRPPDPREMGAAPPDAARVMLIDRVPANRVELGPDLEVMSGSHDEDGVEAAHPLPGAEVDRPGRRSAEIGGAAPGGPDSWTGRRDRESYRTQVWSHAERNRLPRQRTGRERRAPESVVRAPRRGFDERFEARRRARAGDDRSTPGGGVADDPGGPAGIAGQARWEDEDPVFSGAAGSLRKRRVRGRTGAIGQALADRGERATEAARRGPAVDVANVASASSELDPAPIEMTEARAGGRDRGVAGRRSGTGSSRRGVRGGGDAASRALLDRGPDAPAVRAQRQNPYFRRMYRRLDRRIVYPRELALAMQQGEVVVRFTLAASGAVSDVAVVKSSGFAILDRTVVAALREVAPFGRVPVAVLRGRPAVRVLAPYAFRNPLIR